MKKPTKKTVMVERWDCGIKNHSHLTERVACACIERQRKKTVVSKPKRTHEEVMIFSSRRESGEKWRVIAEEMGVTTERARQIILKHRRIAAFRNANTEFRQAK